MKRVGYKSPGRRAMAKLCRKATVPHYTMRGEVPAELEEDREFFAIFQQWKREGTPSDGELYQRLCERFNEVTRDVTGPIHTDPVKAWMHAKIFGSSLLKVSGGEDAA